MLILKRTLTHKLMRRYIYVVTVITFSYELVISKNTSKLILGKNHITVLNVMQVSHKLVILNNTLRLILEKCNISVVIVIKFSHEIVNLKDISGDTLETNHFIVFPIWKHTLGENLFNVNIVTSLSFRIVIFLLTSKHTLATNHINAFIVIRL